MGATGGGGAHEEKRSAWGYMHLVYSGVVQKCTLALQYKHLDPLKLQMEYWDTEDYFTLLTEHAIRGLMLLGAPHPRMVRESNGLLVTDRAPHLVHVCKPLTCSCNCLSQPPQLLCHNRRCLHAKAALTRWPPSCSNAVGRGWTTWQAGR